MHRLLELENELLAEARALRAPKCGIRLLADGTTGNMAMSLQSFIDADEITVLEGWNVEDDWVFDWEFTEIPLSKKLRELIFEHRSASYEFYSKTTVWHSLRLLVKGDEEFALNTSVGKASQPIPFGSPRRIGSFEAGKVIRHAHSESVTPLTAEDLFLDLAEFPRELKSLPAWALKILEI